MLLANLSVQWHLHQQCNAKSFVLWCACWQAVGHALQEFLAGCGLADDATIPGYGIVTNLHVTDLHIEGPVPQQTCIFPELRELDLDGGNLTGTIPVFLTTCFHSINEIDLSYNQVGTFFLDIHNTTLCMLLPTRLALPCFYLMCHSLSCIPICFHLHCDQLSCVRNAALTIIAYA